MGQARAESKNQITATTKAVFVVAWNVKTGVIFATTRKQKRLHWYILWYISDEALK